MPASIWQQALPPASYRALVLPFLDYPLAMDLLSGSLQSPVARRLHDALLSGLPVLALRYHCDPASELNQLLGRNRARHTPGTCRRRSAVWARSVWCCAP
ncbi:hypothetical protein ACSZOE_08005 [Aeromonas hydrophila]